MNEVYAPKLISESEEIDFIGKISNFPFELIVSFSIFDNFESRLPLT